MQYARYTPSGGRSTPPNVGASKHDADCLRRKAEMGWQYICTCGLTDEQIAQVRP